MAASGAKKVDCKLDTVGTLKLKDDRRLPEYTGLVVLSADDMVIVAKRRARKLQLYSIHDGKLLATTDKLQSRPWDICVVKGRDIQVVTTLDNGQIKIMPVELKDQTAKIGTMRTLDIRMAFDACHGVRGFRYRDKLVVSGVKDRWIYYGFVSLVDGNVDTIHKICKGKWSYLSISHTDTTVYISCNAGRHSGVYAFDVRDGTSKFVYQHKKLTWPMGISVDTRGFIYVCNWRLPFAIHQLTEDGKQLTVHTHMVPKGVLAMYWEKEKLYATISFSKKVMILCPKWNDQQGHIIPEEILRMDDESVQLYKKALQDGKEKVYNIRVMVVGQYGVGKTTLTKRLLGRPVDISERKSTEGIDVHKHCCTIPLVTGEWILQHEDSDHLSRFQRLMNLLSGQDQKPDARQEQEGHTDVIYQREATSELDSTNNIDTTATLGSDINQEVSLTSYQPPEELSFSITDQTTSNVAIPVIETQSNESEKKKDAVMEIIHLTNKNADKLKKDRVTYASLSVWDFAGQYAFYTTHQTFLSSRAIYLLVIDLDQQVTDPIIDDKCFLDMEGTRPCKVHDLIEIWLNSIHSCAPSPQASIPNVILVGTHVDKLSEKSRKEVIEEYFKKLRYMLREKPTIQHLMDDFAIDNTQQDPLLEELKRRIFELSSQQSHWGEEKPARWLSLEQAIMTLKASGAKVVPRSLVEEINRSGSVRIEDRSELELFLRFHHEIGTILYFSVEGLREKIVLDTQWMIDAQKSLITADTFIRNTPAITSKWYEFKETGKLTLELIDAVWTKDNNPDLYDNKEHILLLMEKLNIISKPRSHTEVENYFLAPCMLRETTPKDVIFFESHTEMESSSVLCYVFEGKFLPSPIFHRLLAACVAHWPISKKNSKHLIFCGCGVFNLDLHHRLTVCFRDYVIFARVTRMGTIEKTPSSKLCIEVKKFLTTTLSCVIGYLGQSLRFEHCIQCPKSDGYSVDCLIPVTDFQGNEDVPCYFHDSSHLIMSHDVLKFWFQDEEHSDDGSAAGPLPSPPTSDTDRFMHMAYLLVDVGSQVLRQLFHHHIVTATCSLDQYLANNRTCIDKLHNRNILEQSQMDIMFPPGGSTNLETYDITLLSVLFNNIVHPLSKKEKKQITYLRNDRNEIYAHASSCKMNINDYQKFWKRVSSKLIYLSKQCCDPNFENQILLEIQRVQVAGIPPGLYLNILKDWFKRIETVQDELQDVKLRLEAIELKETSPKSDS